MKFRTKLKHTSSFKINHSDRILALGSCFATNVGEKMRHLKWPIEVNPLGIVYNPASVFKLLNLVLGHEVLNRKRITRAHDWELHYDFHSHMSSQENVADTIQDAIHRLQSNWSQCGILFITFGTAWVYRLKSDGQIVANCHKQAQHNFSKELMSIDDLCNLGRVTFERLFESLPEVQVVISVSPVRHLANGLVDNNRSKARLLEMVHYLADDFSQIHYFPGYELLLDDLRDYRFYDRDLSHPNSLAMDYIWEFFSSNYLSDGCQTLVSQIEKIKRGISHRPFQADSSDHQQFLRKLAEQIKEMIKNNPYQNWNEEFEKLNIS